MPAREISAVAVGKIAQEALAQAQPANVLGKTSRGLFLRLASGWMIFLSFEPYHGPLTLNLYGDPAMLRRLEVGAAAYSLAGDLFFPAIHLSIPINQAEPWQAPAPSADILPLDLLHSHLFSVIRLAVQQHPANRLVAWLGDRTVGQEPSTAQNSIFAPHLARLQAACQEGQVQAISGALDAFLGLGQGLTPSGDDLVTGFLLTVNRWGQQLFPHRTFLPAQEFLNREIPARAGRRTSALSANLIACAARGQADERLILALDGVVTGKLQAQACLTVLAGWGSSSGLDTLAGMAFVLFACLPHKDGSSIRG